MRIVLDTNVLIASFIARGFCHELFEHCNIRHTIVGSEFILNEVREKLIEKFKYTAATADEVVALLRSRTQIVLPTALSTSVCRDSDDDTILATALSGNCDCIVTGDRDLLILQEFEGVMIFSPRDFSEFENKE
ncbi:MAG: putative toxin-antitoxin system toxin component, PIN family [Pyrinomonadaceae bacterium]